MGMYICERNCVPIPQLVNFPFSVIKMLSQKQVESKGFNLGHS